MKLYVNGALAATAMNPSPWKATWQLTIGAVTVAQGGSSNFVNGSISDVRVHQQALTANDAGVLAHGDALNGPVGGAGAANARELRRHAQSDRGGRAQPPHGHRQPRTARARP
jgi:hypothetical protein